MNRGTITHNDFTAENRLTDDAFDTVLGKYDGYLNKEVEHQATERSLTREEVLRLQATLLRKRITGELDEYPPFVIKQ